jgi:hypothetical protein
MFAAFLHRWRSSPRRQPAKCPPRFVPQLVRLEDRTLPSTFMVTNLNDSGSGSLRDAVAYADSHAGTQIDFKQGLHGTITLSSGELDITSNTTIKGPGANQITVSGDNSRVFDIAAGQTVSMTGLTIANGLAAQGGGIDNFGSLTLTGCTVLDNTAVGGAGDSTTPDAANGGGIANEVGASLNLTRDLLKGNVASASAGDDAFGGGVLNLGSTTVVGCTFTGNEVTGGVSSSYYDGSYGGAIESFGFAPDQLYGTTLTVSDSSFNHNQAIGANGVAFGTGAGIDVEYSAVATITNCSFTDNVGSAGTGGYGQGGALFAEGCTLNVSNTAFTGNQALGGSDGGSATGGALFFLPGATVTMSKCSFIGNQAIGGNGSPAATPYSGQGLGGAIDDDGATLSLTDCTLIRNQAIGGSDGANPTGGNVTGSSEYGAGGGIIVLYGSTVTITNSLISGNVAAGGSSTAGTGGAASGGGIEDANGIGGPASSLTLTNSAVIGNLALGGAGASGVAGGLAIGGGLDISFGSTATVTNTTFLGNSARGGAGGAGANGGDGYGGGIAVASQSYFGFPDTSSLSLSDSALIGNSAVGGNGGTGGNGGNGFGGGLFVGPGGTATTDQAFIVFNQARGGEEGSGGSDGAGSGGGVYNLGAFSPDVLTLIKYNHASTSNDNVGP